MNRAANSFEFLGKINFGQYLPLQSPLHRSDPRARIIALIFVLAGLTFAPRPLGLLLGLGALAVGLRLGRIPFRFVLRGMLTPLPFLIIIALLQILFNPRLDVSPAWLTLGPIILTPAGLLAGLMILLRFTGLILGLGLASFCLSTSELIRGLQSLLSPLQKIGLPTRDGIMAVQIMLRFIPLLAISAERIARAQAARGGEWGSAQGSLVSRVRQVIPLLVPLFLTGLRRAEALALAMDARGYDNPAARPTALVEMHLRTSDFTLMATAFAIFWLLILI
jgi:energy-coupling factor transport system permease protein